MSVKGVMWFGFNLAMWHYGRHYKKLKFAWQLRKLFHVYHLI